jgi:hypothetical protein
MAVEKHAFFLYQSKKRAFTQKVNTCILCGNDNTGYSKAIFNSDMQVKK